MRRVEVKRNRLHKAISQSEPIHTGQSNPPIQKATAIITVAFKREPDASSVRNVVANSPRGQTASSGEWQPFIHSYRDEALTFAICKLHCKLVDRIEHTLITLSLSNSYRLPFHFCLSYLLPYLNLQFSWFHLGELFQNAIRRYGTHDAYDEVKSVNEWMDEWLSVFCLESSHFPSVYLKLLPDF